MINLSSELYSPLPKHKGGSGLTLTKDPCSSPLPAPLFAETWEWFSLKLSQQKRISIVVVVIIINIIVNITIAIANAITIAITITFLTIK